MIANLGPVDYRDMQLTVKPDAPVAAIGQTTALPDVTFSAGRDMTMRQEIVDLALGKRRVIPLVLIATSAGYTVRCKLLPRQRRMEIVMGLVAVNDTPKTGTVPGSRPDHGTPERDYVLKVTMSDQTAHWFGHGTDKNGRIEEVFGAKPVSRHVSVVGTYKLAADDEPHSVSQEIEVRDLVDDLIKQKLR